MSESIHADMTSRDPRRVHSAMWAIVRLRDVAELDALASALPEIERATAGLQLGGMFHSNDETLRFALRKLEHHRDGDGCLCRLYPELLSFDPEQEVEAGHVRIVERRYVDDKWLASYRCTCALCGAAFEVEYGEQHASWWRWTAVDD